jgi:hypothetical protein
MGMILNDEDKCPQCGAYWNTNGYCSNGHPKPTLIDNGNAKEAKEKIEAEKKAKQKKLIIIVPVAIVLIVALAALMMTVIDAYTPHYTVDRHFATERGFLNCTNGYVYNATDGAPKPDNPDFYFCTPYDKQPDSLFYELNETQPKFTIGEKDELVIFHIVCPMQDKDPGYQIYVGDWTALWKKCVAYNAIAYLYSEEDGYKNFCCVPTDNIRLNSPTNQTQIRRDKILLYNETHLMINNQTCDGIVCKAN